jgi:hypothetical protein
MKVFKEITADTVKSSQVSALAVTEPAGRTAQYLGQERVQAVEIGRYGR